MPAVPAALGDTTVVGGRGDRPATTTDPAVPTIDGVREPLGGIWSGRKGVGTWSFDHPAQPAGGAARSQPAGIGIDGYPCCARISTVPP